ncbi:DUF6233 domain-containing protein [Streptomyces sp. NPDC008141]|uniref:DUF6233 domain-containing protein n=1 Tax=Streptomyces sp. NPDC008141 TaxID=3364815 RepID=UPI0036E85F55
MAELERQEAAAAPAGRTPLPLEPEWKLSTLKPGGRPSPDAVHTGDCRMAGAHTKRLTREQALRAITEEGITACPYCRPDTDLGVL